VRRGRGWRGGRRLLGWWGGAGGCVGGGGAGVGRGGEDGWIGGRGPRSAGARGRGGLALWRMLKSVWVKETGMTMRCCDYRIWDLVHVFFLLGWCARDEDRMFCPSFRRARTAESGGRGCWTAGRRLRGAWARRIRGLWCGRWVRGRGSGRPGGAPWRSGLGRRVGAGCGRGCTAFCLGWGRGAVARGLLWRSGLRLWFFWNENGGPGCGLFF